MHNIKIIHPNKWECLVTHFFSRVGFQFCFYDNCKPKALWKSNCGLISPQPLKKFFMFEWKHITPCATYQCQLLANWTRVTNYINGPQNSCSYCSKNNLTHLEEWSTLQILMSCCHFLMGLSGPTNWMYSFACFGVGFSELGWSSISTLPTTNPLLKLTPTVKNLLCQSISGASFIHHPQILNEQLIVHWEIV